MIERWKGMAEYVSRKTGRQFSEEAMRKIVNRDSILRRALELLHGRPAIKPGALDEWIRRGRGVKRVAA